MKIVDLTKNNLKNIPRACGSLLPDKERQISRKVKQEWVKTLLDQGFKMKLATDDEGYFIGMIEYLPIEKCLQNVTGRNLAYIDCIWVLNQHQKKGVGRTLLEACFQDTKDKFQGIATWATNHAIMNRGFFEHFGFKAADRDSSGLDLFIMFKSYVPQTRPPELLKVNFKPEPKEGALNIDLFFNPWCPYSYGVACRAKHLLLNSGEKVSIQEHYLSSRKAIEKFGLAGGVFIDGIDCTLDFLMGRPLSEILKLTSRVLNNR